MRTLLRVVLVVAASGVLAGTSRAQERVTDLLSWVPGRTNLVLFVDADAVGKCLPVRFIDRRPMIRQVRAGAAYITGFELAMRPGTAAAAGQRRYMKRANGDGGQRRRLGARPYYHT